MSPSCQYVAVMRAGFKYQRSSQVVSDPAAGDSKVLANSTHRSCCGLTFRKGDTLALENLSACCLIQVCVPHVWHNLGVIGPKLLMRTPRVNIFSNSPSRLLWVRCVSSRLCKQRKVSHYCSNNPTVSKKQKRPLLLYQRCWVLTKHSAFQTIKTTLYGEPRGLFRPIIGNVPLY